MQLSRSSSRISWIDMAKGYGTIFVIYAHIGSGLIRTWLYSFHLPLFFFLSGYVFSTKDNFKNFISKKLKSIVVPYFCLGIPMVLFEFLKYVIRDEFSMEFALGLVKDFLLQQRLWTLWYMACLFCLNILFYFVVKLCSREWMLFLVSALLPVIGLQYYEAGGPSLYWNLDTCAMAMPFFALGYLYKMHAERIDSIFSRFNRGVLFGVLALINMGAWIFSLDSRGVGLEMFYSDYGNPVFTYISAFAGIFCVIIVSKRFVIKPLQYLGENSMLYYAWHQTIMMPILEKVMAVVGLDMLMSYGFVGGEAYKWIFLIGIILALTICNWCIGKLGLKFVLGK